MKLTKKRMTTAIGMSVGITLLTGAAFASYNTSNGYEIGKTAVKGLMQNENYTAECRVALLIDGENVNTTTFKELYDRNGDVKVNRTDKSETCDAYKYYMGANQYEEYVQDNDHISVYHRDDGTEESNVSKGYGEYYTRGTFDLMNVNDDEDDKEMQSKIIRFTELVADTFVGDLKNNIVYVSGDDGSSSYEMNLDAVQIPEVVNAGLSAMFSAVNASNQNLDAEYQDPFMQFGTDPIIKNVSLKFTVDGEGRLTNAEASSTLSGNGHEGTVEFELKLYDYGTTQPQRIDVSTLKNPEIYNMKDDRGLKRANTVDTEAAEKGYHVDEDGNVLNSNDEIVGTVEINGDGEGVIVYNER